MGRNITAIFVYPSQMEGVSGKETQPMEPASKLKVLLAQLGQAPWPPLDPPPSLFVAV